MDSALAQATPPSSLDWSGSVAANVRWGRRGGTKCGHVNVAKDGPVRILCHRVRLILAKGQI